MESWERHLELTKLLDFQGPLVGAPAVKARRKERQPVFLTSEVLSVPSLGNLRMGLRQVRLFLVLKYIFDPGIYLSLEQWDFARNTLTDIALPKSLWRRYVGDSPHQIAAKRSLFIAVLLAWLLRNTKPGEIPDATNVEKLSQFLQTFFEMDIDHFRKTYFGEKPLLDKVLAKISYIPGTWLPQRRRKPIRSPSAVNSGTPRQRNPWKPTPKRLLAKESSSETIKIDPLFFLGIVERELHGLSPFTLRLKGFYL